VLSATSSPLSLKYIGLEAQASVLQDLSPHDQQGLVPGTQTFVSTSLLQFVPRYIFTTLCVLPVSQYWYKTYYCSRLTHTK